MQTTSASRDALFVRLRIAAGQATGNRVKTLIHEGKNPTSETLIAAVRFACPLTHPRNEDILRQMGS